MPDFKDSYFKDIKINPEILKQLKTINPAEKLYEHQTIVDAAVRNMQRNTKLKEQEELRRHNELISALNNAANNGATIVIGDNANDVQVIQNSDNSKQNINNTQALDYDKVLDVLEKIKKCFNSPLFEEEFSVSKDIVKKLVNDTIEAVNNKKDKSIIIKSLNILKDLAINTGGSVIAAGILSLINSII
jgi:hypothetical protein